MIEGEVLYAALKDIDTALAILKPEDFRSRQYGEVYKYIIEFYRRYGRPPSVESVNRKFKGILEPTKVDLPELLEEMIRGAVSDKIDTIVSRLEVLKEKGTSEEVISALEKGIALIGPHVITMDSHLGEFGKAPKVVGSIGWKELDKAIGGGVCEKDFILIAGRPKSGKTMLLVKIAVNLWKQQLRVLFFTRETSQSSIQRRVVALYAGRAPRSVKFMKEEEIRRLLKDISEKDLKRFCFSGGFFDEEGLSQIEGKCGTHRPDVVLIDGLYLFDREGGADWAELTRLSRQIKRFAYRTGLPIITTMQLSREGEDEEVGLRGVAYADALVQDPDVILKLSATEELTYLDRRIIKVLGARDGETGAKFQFFWELDKGIIELEKRLTELEE